MNDYTFGNFIYLLREQKGYTQADIAAMLKVTPAAVSKWENGESKPRIETLFKLADILGVKAEELIAGRRLDNEQFDQSAVDNIYKRYEYITKIETHTEVGVKFKRILAFLIDWNITGIPIFLISSLIVVILETNNVADWITGWCMLFLILLFPIGVILRDFIWKGRSIGKRITGLCVLDMQTGERPKFLKLVARSIFFMLMYIDGIIMLVSGKSIGDRVAHTVVVSVRSTEKDIGKADEQTKINLINSYQYSEYEEKRRRRKAVIIAISCILVFVGLLVSVIKIALERAKTTEQYEIAYSFVANSNKYKKSVADGEEIDLVGYSFETQTSDGITTKTAEFTFKIGKDTVQVLCYEDAGEWVVVNSTIKSP